MAGACQMLKLVKQNRQHRKEIHCDFTGNDYLKKLHFCYISKSYKIPHKLFWMYQYLYFHNVQGNSRHVGQVVNRSLEYHSVSVLQDIENGVSNSCFVKIKTFRLQTSKLLRNRRKTYILCVIYNRFYFGEVKEEVFGKCSRQGISEPRTDFLSISGLFQKKSS